MEDSRFKARSQRLVDFGVLCNEIASPGRKHVSKALLAKLVRYRLPLTAIRDDPSLKKIAINRLSVLDSMHDYAVELNRGNLYVINIAIPAACLTFPTINTPHRYTKENVY
jgi:hypothetical protein